METASRPAGRLWAILEEWMDSFLSTKFTIGEGLGMGAWSLGHIAWLAAGALFIAIMCITFRRSTEAGRRYLLRLVAGLILADEIVKYLITIPTGQWEWSFLPLHLCSLSVFVILAHAIRPNDAVAEYLYALGLPAALMALIFPNWMMLPCLNWESIHSFSIHILLVCYPMMLLAGGWRPRFSRLRFWIVPLALAVILAVCLNATLDTNFFFLNGGEGGNPLSFLEGIVGGWYVLAIPFIAAALWAVMYIAIPKVLRWC